MQIDDNSNFIKKRIFSVLIKSEENNLEEKIISEIGQNLEDLIEMILNNSENRIKINYIKSFICNIVEINKNLLKFLPNYENLKIDNEINFRFIVSSKNIYNQAIEIYFSIYDMIDVRKFICFNIIFI
jgi:hypothetical protein